MCVYIYIYMYTNMYVYICNINFFSFKIFSFYCQPIASFLTIFTLSLINLHFWCFFDLFFKNIFKLKWQSAWWRLKLCEIIYLKEWSGTSRVKKKKKKMIIGDESFKKLFSNYFDEKNFFRKKPANELNKENAKRQTN